MSRFFNQQMYLKNLRRRSVQCRETGCPSTVVNKDCMQVKCKRHCISSGGCCCSGHSSQRLDDAFFAELEKLANTPPPAIPPSDNQESRYRISHPHWFSPPAPARRLPVSVQPSSISFTLVDFHKSGHPGLVTAITSQGLWWSRPGDRRYEVFSPDFARWMEVEPTYAHDLRTRRQILIRSPGVDGLDQDEHIAALLSEHREEDISRPTPTSSRPRRPLPASPPTRPIRRPLPASPPMRLIYDLARTPSPARPLKRKRAVLQEDDEDDDVVIVGYTAAVKIEPRSPQRRRRRSPVLKDKFLHGKRNRRLDHLLHILIHAVLPYYALKQRRQDLGLEGPDAEVQKRQDIEIRGATYTADDIALIEEDGVFKVTSQSDPSRAYDVDLKAYTCTCFDFPGISFCKHLCAVQRIFGKDFHDHLDNNDPHTARPAIPQVRSLSTVADPDPDAMEMTGGAPMQNLASIADQLERLAARLRLPPTTQIPDDAIASLQSSLGAMFLATDDVSILPSKQRLAPVVKNKTARNTMMPRIKTKRTPAGDAAYGAGASSGSKASKTTNKKKTRKPVLPAPNFSLPPPPPPLLISAPAQTYQQAPPLPPHASYPPQGLLHPPPAPSNVSSAYPGYGIPPTYYYSQYPPYHSVPYTSYQQ